MYLAGRGDRQHLPKFASGDCVNHEWPVSLWAESRRCQCNKRSGCCHWSGVLLLDYPAQPMKLTCFLCEDLWPECQYPAGLGFQFLTWNKSCLAPNNWSSWQNTEFSGRFESAPIARYFALREILE